MVSKRTKSRRRRLRRGGYSKKEYELIGQSALEDEIDQLEIGLYLIVGLSIFSIFGMIIGIANSNMGLVAISLLFLTLFIISYLLSQRNLGRIKSSKHTKSRIYRAGIDKVEKDKRDLADAKKYKAAYTDQQGHNFTLQRRKAKFSKKRKGSRKSRK